MKLIKLYLPNGDEMKCHPERLKNMLAIGWTEKPATQTKPKKKNRG